MKGMLFFIIGLIIVFGLFKITQDNTSLSGEVVGEPLSKPSSKIDKQEFKQAPEE